jgi:hypothetical protein
MSTVEIRAGAPIAWETGRSSARTRVYVSSTALDLREERKAVIDAVRHTGCEPVSMEAYGADGRRPIEVCLADVASCQVYLGIVAWRYGSCPPGETKSFTHLEYEKAASLGKHVLLFHLSEGAAWPMDRADRSQRRVRRFREDQAKDHIVDAFSSPDQLAAGVRRALDRLYGAVTTAVPELLPYVADRHKQRDRLAAAARSHELDHSPSMIVVHGAADQVHHKFVEYLRERLLTRYVGVGPVHPVSVPLRADEFDHPDVITGRIADSCGYESLFDADALARELHDSGLVIMLHFRLEVMMRRGRPDARGVARLVGYFARWPRYRPLRVVPVISAQYGEPAGWSGRLPWMSAASTSKFAAAVEDAVLGAACDAVILLPRLANVEQSEVEVWADQAEVRRFLGDRDPMPVIRQIFQEHGRSSKERGISMELLAAELTHLLDHRSRSSEAV